MWNISVHPILLMGNRYAARDSGIIVQYEVSGSCRCAVRSRYVFVVGSGTAGAWHGCIWFPGFPVTGWTGLCKRGGTNRFSATFIPLDVVRDMAFFRTDTGNSWFPFITRGVDGMVRLESGVSLWFSPAIPACGSTRSHGSAVAVSQWSSYDRNLVYSVTGSVVLGFNNDRTKEAK